MEKIVNYPPIEEIRKLYDSLADIQDSDWKTFVQDNWGDENMFDALNYFRATLAEWLQQNDPQYFG